MTPISPQHQDEDDDVGSLYGALDHAHCHVGEPLRRLGQPLIGAGDGDGLADGAVDELLHPDIDVEPGQLILSGGHAPGFLAAC